MTRWVAGLAAALLLPWTARAQRAEGWRVRTDGLAGDTISHVQMPPGWHVTTGPGALLYAATNVARGRFAVSMEVHLFPGESREGYGLFLGGASLDARDARYVRFVARRDGQVAIEQVVGDDVTPLLAWQANPAVKPHPGGQEGTALNVLTVRAEQDSVYFEGNGQRLAARPRAEVPVDGIFGMRAGAGVNLHVTNLDLVTRLAPARAPRR